MSLALIRLKPAARYDQFLAGLQLALDLPPDTSDMDPGVLLALVPITARLDRMLSAFQGDIAGRVHSLEQQTEGPNDVVVLKLTGGIEDAQKDFDDVSFLPGLGTHMVLALGLADPAKLEQVSQDMPKGLIMFDELEAVSLEDGSVLLNQVISQEDTDNDDTDDE